MKNLFFLLCILPMLGCFGPSEEEKAFDNLRESISVSSEEFADKNAKARDEILEMIDNDRDTPRSKVLLDAINKVDSTEAAMMDYLDEIVAQLEIIGEKDEDGFIQNKADIDKGQSYFLGDNPLVNDGRGDGKGAELADKLIVYTETCNQIREKYSNDLETFQSPVRLSSKSVESWEYETFHNQPLIAHLAMMEKFKLDVGEMSRELTTVLNVQFQQPVYVVETLQVH